LEAQHPLLGIVKSFFGAWRVNDGRDACGKTVVFGIFERYNRVVFPFSGVKG